MLADGDETACRCCWAQAAVRAQLEHGDIIVVNKADLVHRIELAVVVAAVRREFSGATVLTATFGDVPLEAILHPSSGSPARRSRATLAPAVSETGGDDGHSKAGHDDVCDHTDHTHCRHTRRDGTPESDHLAKDAFVSVSLPPAPVRCTRDLSHAGIVSDCR